MHLMSDRILSAAEYLLTECRGVQLNLSGDGRMPWGPAAKVGTWPVTPLAREKNPILAQRSRRPEEGREDGTLRLFKVTVQMLQEWWRRRSFPFQSSMPSSSGEQVQI